MNYWKGWDNMASKKSYLEKAAGEMTKFFTGAEAEADRQEDTRKPLNDTEKAVLEKYNSGMTVQNDIAEAIGKDKAGVSRALKRIREEYPELLQEPEAGSGSAAETPQAEPQKPAEATKPAETIESKPEPEKPQETAQEKPQKAKKQVFSFRAEVNAITCWKAYATATGQTMESVGNAAMTEFLKNHPLTENEKVVFDALTASVNK